MPALQYYESQIDKEAMDTTSCLSLCGFCILEHKQSGLKIFEGKNHVCFNHV